MSNTRSKPGRRPVIAHLVRTLALPILLLWLLITVGLHMITPPLDAVADQHSVPMTPTDAPAFKAMMRIGKVFKEFDSDSSAMVVLEGQDKLGDSAHVFYNDIVSKLLADTAQAHHAQAFW